MAKRGFSAAARSHESVHFSVGNGEIYVVKHFFVVVVGKTNVLKHYIAFEVVHLVRRGAFKLDRNIHNRDKTSESRHAVLQLLEKLYERLHGRNEKVYRNHKRHEVYVVEMLLVVYAKQCACKQHYDVVYFGDKAHACRKRAHCLVRLRARLDVTCVVFFKLFLLVLGVCIRFRHSNTCDAVFKRSVDVADLFSALSERLVHILSARNGDNEKHGQKRKHNQGQFPAYRAKIRKRAYRHERGDKKVFGAVVGKLAHVEEVVRHPRHKLSRFVVVVKGIRQLFEMLEQIRSHRRLHFYAHYVTVVVDIILHSGAQKVYTQKYRAKYKHLAYHAVWYALAKYALRHDRINKPAYRKDKRANHICGKRRFVRLVVCHESFEQMLIVGSILFVFCHVAFVCQ